MKKPFLVIIVLLIIFIVPISALSDGYPTFVPDPQNPGAYYWTGPNEVEEDITTEEEAKTIRTLVLPADMQFYNGYYNYQLEALEEYKVDNTSSFLTCLDGVLFTKDMQILLAYPRNKSCTDYTIPIGVTGVAENAFAGNPYLQVVTFSDDVKWVEHSAFSGCGLLRMIKLNNALSCIGDKAFEYCNNLTELKCPNGLRVIGYRAFYMSGLSNITLNDGLTCVMGEAFFTHHFGNAEISLPETVLYISRTAFSPDENITILTSNFSYHSRLHIDGVSAVRIP